MMDETPIVGSITFSNIANPNTWGLGGDSKALVFSCPSEAKRGEELFTAMQDAAFKAGREAGMREASEIANREEDQFINASELTDSMGDQRHYSACASGAGSVAVAILSAIGGGK